MCIQSMEGISASTGVLWGGLATPSTMAGSGCNHCVQYRVCDLPPPPFASQCGSCCAACRCRRSIKSCSSAADLDVLLSQMPSQMLCTNVMQFMRQWDDHWWLISLRLPNYNYLSTISQMSNFAFFVVEVTYWLSQDIDLTLGNSMAVQYYFRN